LGLLKTAAAMQQKKGGVGQAQFPENWFFFLVLWILLRFCVPCSFGLSQLLLKSLLTPPCVVINGATLLVLFYVNASFIYFFFASSRDVVSELAGYI